MFLILMNPSVAEVGLNRVSRVPRVEAETGLPTSVSAMQIPELGPLKSIAERGLSDMGAGLCTADCGLLCFPEAGLLIAEKGLIDAEAGLLFRADGVLAIGETLRDSVSDDAPGFHDCDVVCPKLRVSAFVVPVRSRTRVCTKSTYRSNFEPFSSVNSACLGTFCTTLRARSVCTEQNHHVPSRSTM